VSFEADLARLDNLAERIAIPGCRCQPFLILFADDEDPKPCQLHGFAGTYAIRLQYCRRHETVGGV